MAVFPELGYTAATERSTVDRPLPFRPLTAAIEVFSDNFRLRLSICAGLYRQDHGAVRNTEVGREREASSCAKPQYSEANVMHFLFNLLRIKGLYMFRALLAHPQEALQKRHLVYCVRVMSVGCIRMKVERVKWNCVLL
jgi:hypothetical protein